MRPETLVKIVDVKKYFPLRGGFMLKAVGFAKAIDGLSLNLERGKTLGLVGESGSGKSTLARLILRLIPSDYGRIIFKERDITHIPLKRMRPLRKDMQIIFQDPYSSLDPRFTVERILVEAFLAFGQKRGVSKRIEELLLLVGLEPQMKKRYTFELSGGQCQRIAIARALALSPEFLILDEPVSNLDVSLQAQVLDLLVKLQSRLNLTYLYISHNLRTIKLLSDKVAVMYLGKIVEQASKDELFSSPVHPYTEALLSAASDRRIVLKGEPASNIQIPSGCPFHPRCFRAQELCSRVIPPLEEKGPGHRASCHFPLKSLSKSK